MSFCLRFDPLPASPKFQSAEFGGGEALDGLEMMPFCTINQPLPPFSNPVYGRRGRFWLFAKTILRIAEQKSDSFPCNLDKFAQFSKKVLTYQKNAAINRSYGI